MRAVRSDAGLGNWSEGFGTDSETQMFRNMHWTYETHIRRVRKEGLADFPGRAIVVSMTWTS